MKKKYFQSEAPSNLALIKYMGKEKGKKNQPLNGSFSLTLPHLKSYVVAEQMDEFNETGRDKICKDQWERLETEETSKKEEQNFHLSLEGQKRFLDHFGKLKKEFSIRGFFKIKSANNFASDCGLASSASSFAALTLCAYQIAQFQNSTETKTQQELAALSAKGSGSSARSFFSPCCLWSTENHFEALNLKSPFDQMLHSVVLIDTAKKPVSSSQAHERVLKSPLIKGRPERVEARMKKLLQAFDEQEWRAAYYIIWDEFLDMHSLFHTSDPRFSYMTDKTEEVLAYLQLGWESDSDGPLVTMDAGANVHLIFRKDQKELQKKLKIVFEKTMKVI